MDMGGELKFADDGTGGDLSPGLQELADLAGKMGSVDSENTYDEHGFDSNGINKYTNTKYDPDGYNRRGLNEANYDREGFWHRPGKGRTSIRYHEGYDWEGFNRKGFDRDGFDHEGFDLDGYNREGLDKDGYTREYNAKFNKYGVDENGYQKNGEIDPDVDFAIKFAESGVRDQNKYSAESGIDEKIVREKIELARKKCPNIDKIISDLLLTGNKMRSAVIAKDCEKLVGGEINMDEFWEKHPKLAISDALNFIDSPDGRKVFSDKAIEGVVMDSDNIENNLQKFGSSQYNVAEAIKGVEDFKKVYNKFAIDGSPEQAKQKRENTKKLYDIIKYFGKYKNRNLDSLLGSRYSRDGGQTWIEFNGEAIGRAMDALKKDKKLICVQTVKDYIIKR